VPNHLAVIPCRWGSTRFPGKPLAALGGKPLLWHVHQRCLEAKLIVGVVVATDDQRIAQACEQLDIPFALTGPQATGTDRVAECARQLAADGYINVQGDEPFIDPAAIDAVSAALAQLPNGIAAVNACAPLLDPIAATDHNVVKAVQGSDNRALMFSRQPIPYARGEHPGYLRQLGLYGMTAETLHAFATLHPGPLELAESVEMLRLLEHGHPVHLVITEDNGIAVDTPEDLRHAERLLPGTTSRRHTAPVAESYEPGETSTSLTLMGVLAGGGGRTPT
jgi:3-deoxy-manno-octulosonate cytidylyltransferase (CMP-KDO synthetase)